MLHCQLYVDILRQNEKTHQIFTYFGRFPGQLLPGRSKNTMQYQQTYFIFEKEIMTCTKQRAEYF